MRVFHTSDFVIENPDVIHSRNGLDFGRGFYVTKIKFQAQKYSIRFHAVGQEAYINEYEYVPNPKLNIKFFEAYDREWLQFICDCRRGGEDFKAYDMIEGGVANDKVFETVDLYLKGLINEQQALQRLIYQKPTHQICFITQEAIDLCLKFVRSNIIKP